MAIQGARASFHDAAARAFFRGRPIERDEQATFLGVCESLASGRADAATFAVENTTVGALIPNLALLNKFKLFPVADAWIRVDLSLLARPGETLESIRSLRSHPVALAQCAEFLRERPGWTIVESSDTAESAHDVARGHEPGEAALASPLAAEEYGLAELVRSAQTHKQNFTRFLCLRRSPGPEPSGAACAMFTVDRLGDAIGAVAVDRIRRAHALPLAAGGVWIEAEWPDCAAARAALAQMPSARLVGLFERAAERFSFGLGATQG